MPDGTEAWLALNELKVENEKEVEEESISQEKNIK